MAAMLHQLEAKSSASSKRGLQQLKALMLFVNGSAEEAKCEDLEKVVVGNDPKKFFQIEAQLPP